MFKKFIRNPCAKVEDFYYPRLPRSPLQELQLGRTVQNHPLEVSLGQPESDLDGQVLPIKIYTLGRFAMFIDGKSVEFGRKAPKRPLGLLKALIAFGARSVEINRLMKAVWPDQGAAARSAFDVALMRLRKLLRNPEALVLAGSTLSLNPQFCWVDIWTFERTAAYSDFHSLPSIAKLNDIYRGHFLEHEGDQSWIGNLRDRLAARYREFILRLAQSQERSENWSLAAQIYRLALEHDNLTEEFHYRLMLCELRLGRRAEAIKTYRRCSTLLSINLQVKPSQLIETLYQKALAG